ncbi:TIR-NBS-LRR resistance protein, partial [Trifolium medium]|nr:TIR-NBS-LRR resistance protein [Trifolium medium]
EDDRVERMANSMNVMAAANPPRFRGDGGPAAADLWLQAMEKILGAIHCPEEEMVTLATYQL